MPKPSSNGVKRARGIQTAREIREAAARMFSAKGFEKTSMAEIAREVGVVEAALYRHYASKRELLDAVLVALLESYRADLETQLPGIRGTRNRLRYLVWRHLRTFVDDMGLARVFIREIRAQDVEDGSVVRTMMQEIARRAVGLIEEGVASGELRGDVPPAVVRDVLFGGVEHVTWRGLRARGRLDVDQAADQILSLVVDGLAVRSPTDLESRVTDLERRLG